MKRRLLGVKRHLLGGVLVATVALFGACSDDADPTPDAAVDLGPKDTGVVDKGVDKGKPDSSPDGGAPSNIGEGCQTGGDTCKEGSKICIIYDEQNQKGICSRECTPDDPQTPLINEDDCGTGNICGEFRYTNGQTFNFCLIRCQVSLTKNPCPASSGQTCAPDSTRYSSLDQPVCWNAACKDGKDCPVLLEKRCTIDSECASEGTGAFCSTGRCALPGNCTPGGVCGPHTQGKPAAKVGDPCKSDKDCPNAGFCLTELDGYPNGYCSIRGCSSNVTEFACPSGSTCHRLFYGGFCHKSCDLTDAATCRSQGVDKGGDYECYAWNNLTIGSGAVSDQPVCTSTLNQSCDSLGSLDCSSLGNQGNPTNMSCRDRRTGAALTNPADPTGFCLDDTASGPFEGAADAGVDAQPADAGVDAQAADAGVDAQAADA